MAPNFCNGDVGRGNHASPCFGVRQKLLNRSNQLGCAYIKIFSETTPQYPNCSEPTNQITPAPHFSNYNPPNVLFFMRFGEIQCVVLNNKLIYDDNILLIRISLKRFGFFLKSRIQHPIQSVHQNINDHKN